MGGVRQRSGGLREGDGGLGQRGGGLRLSMGGVRYGGEHRSEEVGLQLGGGELKVATGLTLLDPDDGVRHWRGLRPGGDGVKQAADRLSTGGVRQEEGGVTHWEGEGEVDALLVESSLRGSTRSDFLLQSSSPLSFSSLSSASEVCSGSGAFGLSVSARGTQASSELARSDGLDATAAWVSADWVELSQPECASCVL